MNISEIFESILPPKNNTSIQFHMSVEPNLVPGKTFAEQQRTVSKQGSRGDAGDTDGHIYTTNNLFYWASQLAFENIDDFPKYVYLVKLKDANSGSIWAAHQDASPSEDVMVLTKLGEIDDEGTNIGKLDWLGEKWKKQNLTEGKNQPSLTPAVRVNGVVYVSSDKNGTHMDALRKVPKDQSSRAYSDGDNRGFVTDKGRYLDRRQAQIYARKYDLLNPKFEWARGAADLTAEVLKPVNEAKFSKPRIMYHGTSSYFLRTILKQGIVPNPKQRYWDSDDNENQYSFSRVSLPGSYWTSNLMTARSASTNTNKKFPGDSLIIIAKIAEQSAYADEDSIDSPLKWAMNDTVKAFHPNIRTDFWMALFDDLNDPHKKQKIQETFMNTLHKHLEGHDLHQPNRQLCDELLETLIMRSMVYENKAGMIMNHWIKNVPELMSISEVEKRLLELRDRLTRSYRTTAIYKQGMYNHTLRITTPVGFSGNNKILSIIETPSWRWIEVDGEKKLARDPLILRYGSSNLPADFLKQYNDRVGAFPGLIDDQGNMLIEPKEKYW